MSMRQQAKNTDMTYKAIAAFIVMLIPIIGILFLIYLNNLGDIIIWFGIVLIMLFPIGVAFNILRYRGKL